jgi:hypothetical protein
MPTMGDPSPCDVTYVTLSLAETGLWCVSSSALLLFPSYGCSGTGCPDMENMLHETLSAAAYGIDVNIILKFEVDGFGRL